MLIVIKLLAEDPSHLDSPELGSPTPMSSSSELEEEPEESELDDKGGTAGCPWCCSGLGGGGGGLWVRGARFGRCRDEARRASAVARSAMKVVAAALVMAGGRHAGRCCCQALCDGGRGWRS